MRLALALFALTFLPGIPLALAAHRRLRDSLSAVAIAGTLGLLWSVFAMPGLMLLQVPLAPPWILGANALPLLAVGVIPALRRRFQEQLPSVTFQPTTVLIVVLVGLALAYPLLTVQHGLPTGDVQKSIYWAQRILETGALPDYREALAFNRDPGDFSIPGLHTLTAALVAVAGEPFRAPAWFSLLSALLLAGLAAAFASLLSPRGGMRAGNGPDGGVREGGPAAPDGSRGGVDRPSGHGSPPGGGESEGDRRSERATLGRANGDSRPAGAQGGPPTRKRQDLLPILAFLLAATNLRFLRYTAAPGYHYQNLIGELLLLASFLFLLEAVAGRGGLRFLLLSAAAAAALPLVHQFSAFLGLILLSSVFILLVFVYRREVATLVTHISPVRQRALAASLLVAVTAVVLAGTLGPLRGKLPHLFTASPHLRAYVVPPASIPALLGPMFMLLGVVGAAVAVSRLKRREIEWRWSLVLAWTVLLLALSQGARSFIDIPSARTLFYLVVPLAVFGALAIATAVERIRNFWPRTSPLLVPAALALALAPTAGASLNDALQSIDHSHQANATLTPATLDLLSFLSSRPPTCPAAGNTAMGGPTGGPPTDRQQPAERLPGDSEERLWVGTAVRADLSAAGLGTAGAVQAMPSGGGRSGQHPLPCADAILIDDWNRRRTTWAILSPYRMLTRVGADLAVIAREAGQSDQRRRQYENLLDFEQIYSLGNSPEILPLLARHGIAAVVGAQGLSDDVFSANPALEKVYENSEVVLYAPTSFQFPVSSFQFRQQGVLANDIGDAEDVFAHLPLSVLAPQISAVGVADGRTFREVRSAVSSIGLNVGAYVPHLWDANGDWMIDTPVEVSLVVGGNGARGHITRGTIVFAEFALPDDGAWHVVRATIPQGILPIDDQGLAFVTLRLDRGPMRLDRASARLIMTGNQR